MITGERSFRYRTFCWEYQTDPTFRDRSTVSISLGEIGLNGRNEGPMLEVLYLIFDTTVGTAIIFADPRAIFQRFLRARGLPPSVSVDLPSSSASVDCRCSSDSENPNILLGEYLDGLEASGCSKGKVSRTVLLLLRLLPLLVFLPAHNAHIRKGDDPVVSRWKSSQVPLLSDHHLTAASHHTAQLGGAKSCFAMNYERKGGRGQQYTVHTDYVPGVRIEKGRGRSSIVAATV